ncbi:hypothetical protein [Gracilibacillus boraciitolerans]|nr:hypothetical protein [Gracilibacillus boraciitolerans]
MLPQFEGGLPVYQIKEFITKLDEQTDVIIEKDYLNDFVNDFFEAGEME